VKALALTPNARRIFTIAGTGLALMFLAQLVAHGTLRSFALGLFVAMAIPLCYFAIERPLVFPFGLYAAMVPFNDVLGEGSAGTLLRLLGIAAIAALSFGILRRGEFAKPNAGTVVLIAIAAWIGISGMWAMDVKEWQGQYLTFIQLFALYAIAAFTLPSRGDLMALCTWTVTGGLAAAAVALWPALHGHLVGPSGRLTLPGGNRYDPVDPNQFAAGLLLPFAILFAATLGTRKLSAQLLNVAGLIMMGITIIMTGSRSAMIALLVLVLYIAFRSRNRFVGFALVGLCAIALVPFAATVTSRWSNALASGGAGRTDIWQVALIVIKQHWLLGTGFGSFPAAFNTAVLKAPLQAYIGWSRAPHDLIVATLVELGILGLALVAFALVMQFRCVAALPRVGGFLEDLCVACEAALIAATIDALFLDMILRKYLWLIFIMIALVRTSILSVIKLEQERRRTACAAPSSLTPVPTSVPERLSA